MKYIIRRILLMLTLLPSGQIFGQDSQVKYYLSITHDVANYDSWKIGFDKYISARQAAEISDIFVKRNINNAKSVTAFFEVKDINKAKAFISDPALKATMSKAGATGIPQFNFYKSAESPDKINSNALITMISHRVKDFPSWEAVHKTTEDLRRKAGITDDLLLQSLSDEHIVTVLSSATSLSGFNKYTSTLPTYWNATHLDPNSKGAKIQSEVVTEPEIKVLF